MDQLKDSIYDAYYSKKGEEFGKKVRNRVHWITQNVKGKKVLDVGCSQGITGILLGREGKEVLAIDSSTSAIEDANKNLLKEEKETQDCIRFERVNFFLQNFEQTFDTVILGEVLEHITDVESFFLKASSLVNEDGRIIVTTPFGINEFIDHKRTFYLMSFINLKKDSLIIEEVKFFGKWIGIIYKKTCDGEQEIELDNNLMKQFEDAIYSLEEDYISKNKELKAKLNDYKKKIKLLEQNKKQKTHKNEIEDQNYLSEKTEKVKLQNELLSVYNENESLLKNQKKLLLDYELLLNRYHNLKNSKLGRLTTKYWKFRGRKRRN